MWLPIIYDYLLLHLFQVNHQSPEENIKSSAKTFVDVEITDRKVLSLTEMNLTGRAYEKEKER